MRRKKVYESTVQSVERTLDIVEALSANRTGIGVTELSKALNLHKSTVHRLLTTLMVRKYVEQDSESGKYRLSVKLFELGNAVLSKLNMRAHALPFLRELRERCRETVQLSIIDQGEVLYIDVLESPEKIGVKAQIGERAPLYCTSSGKIWLAGLPDERLYEVARGMDFKARTPATLTSFETLRDQIAKIKEAGVARDMGEFDADLRGVAAAIKNYRGRVIACISVTIPASRFSEGGFQDLAKSVKDTADKISYSVGYTEK
ncbi:MAG: IclR family transcriptional regulator [candidate division FCPU426 bacterium]